MLKVCVGLRKQTNNNTFSKRSSTISCDFVSKIFRHKFRLLIGPCLHDVFYIFVYIHLLLILCFHANKLLLNVLSMT